MARPKALKYQGTMMVVSRKKDGTPRKEEPDRTFPGVPARDLDENDIRRLSDEQIADMTGGFEPLYVDPDDTKRKASSGYPKELIDKESGFRYGIEDPPDSERKNLPASLKVETVRLVNGKEVDKEGVEIEVHRGRRRRVGMESDADPSAALTREESEKHSQRVAEAKADAEKAAAR
jgi:hypothetical protein